MTAEHSTEETAGTRRFSIRHPKLFWLTAGPIAGLAVGIAVVVWILAYHNREARLHFERNEMELVITNLSRGTVHLYKAGSWLDDATELPLATDRVWLEPGDYFLKVDQAGLISYYPVPVIGSQAGPDEGGSLIVTIRQVSIEKPPTLLTESPPFAFIPSGHFLLGERLNKQDPHYVWLPGYFIGEFEVTNAEFRAFLKDRSGYDDSANWTLDGKRWKSSNSTQSTAGLSPNDTDYFRFGQDDQPVVKVSWYEANAYCHWLTRKLGGATWVFELPNEAEWEKAARGPDGLNYGLTNNVSDREAKLYNWRKNPSAETTVIGWKNTQEHYLPNRYGLFHMSGNVTEWTQSVERAYNRQHPFLDDDRNHDDVAGPRVMRGGSWYTASIAVLSLSYREFFQPSVSAPYLGFRVVARPLP